MDLEQMEHGGVAALFGHRVVKLDVVTHQAVLDNGKKITYGKCLIATGAKPKNLKVFETLDPRIRSKVSLFRNATDFQRLDDICRNGGRIAIVGGGFLGSELACALARRAGEQSVNNKPLQVVQIFPDAGNMSDVLPEYLCRWVTNKIVKEGVEVVPKADVVSVKHRHHQLLLKLSNDEEVRADHVVVCVGVEPDLALARPSKLEIDPGNGGLLCDAELRVRNDVWTAGDCCSFYDVHLGRRRVEHHDHAVVSGRLAGENMTGAGKPYYHQSVFWSDLGPDVGFEGIGRVDSSLPTIAVFIEPEPPKLEGAEQSSEKTGSEVQLPKKSSGTTEFKPAPTETNPAEIGKSLEQDSDDKYDKGIVFYLEGKRVVGILLWNVFNRMQIARRVLNQHDEYDDFGELAKLFDLYGKMKPEELEEK